MELFSAVRAFLAARNIPGYWVGGVIRDVLLERPLHDVDVVVETRAAELGRAFADSIGGAFFVLGAGFDVARVIVEDEQGRSTVDLARRRGDSIQDDLATRDFTINAMAADAASWQGTAAEVIDPFQGLADLRAQRLRALSPEVFVRDPVRLLRAARLEAELNFALDASTALWVRRDAPLVAHAPGERVRDELVRILGARNMRLRLTRLEALDLLWNVLPELRATQGCTQSPPHVYDVFRHSLEAVAAAELCEQAGYQNLAQGAFGEQLTAHAAQKIVGGRTRRELLRLALLLHDIGKPKSRTVDPDGRIRFFGHAEIGADMVEPILRRLRFSADEIAFVGKVILAHLRPILLAHDGITDRAVFRFFRATGDAGVDVAVHAWCDQWATYGGQLPPETDAALQAVIGRLLDRFYHARELVVAPAALISGKDVMETLHLPPGPQIGAILERVQEAQASGEIKTRDEALAYLKIFDTLG